MRLEFIFFICALSYASATPLHISSEGNVLVKLNGYKYPQEYEQPAPEYLPKSFAPLLPQQESQQVPQSNYQPTQQHQQNGYRVPKEYEQLAQQFQRQLSQKLSQPEQSSEYYKLNGYQHPQEYEQPAPEYLPKNFAPLLPQQESQQVPQSNYQPTQQHQQNGYQVPEEYRQIASQSSFRKLKATSPYQATSQYPSLSAYDPKQQAQQRDHILNERLRHQNRFWDVNGLGEAHLRSNVHINPFLTNSFAVMPGYTLFMVPGMPPIAQPGMRAFY